MVAMADTVRDTGVQSITTLISGGLATWLYFKQCRPDQQTDAGVAPAVVSAG
jgi:hypothetical protein